MKELSIFIDESGDLGEYTRHSPYYLISMIFHEQHVDISSDICHLERRIDELGIRDHCVHTGPIIRNEPPYDRCSPQIRRGIFRRFMLFFRHVDIGYQNFYLRRKQGDDVIQNSLELTRQLSEFVRENFAYLESFSQVKIYYDNGQIELTRMLVSVFRSMLANVEFKKVLPKDYKLFQAADFVCTLKLASLRLQDRELTKSEHEFFGGERRLQKDFLKPIMKKTFTNWRKH